jgi:hypothetical protein
LPLGDALFRYSDHNGGLGPRASAPLLLSGRPAPLPADQQPDAVSVEEWLEQANGVRVEQWWEQNNGVSVEQRLEQAQL